VFQRNGLLPALDVERLGLAVNLLELPVEGVEAHAAHLFGHQVARQRDDADVVAGRGFDGHDIAAPERKVVDILVVGTAGVFKAHLHDVGRRMLGILLQPRRFVQLETPLARTSFALAAVVAMAESAAAPHVGRCAAAMVLG